MAPQLALHALQKMQSRNDLRVCVGFKPSKKPLQHKTISPLLYTAQAIFARLFLSKLTKKAMQPFCKLHVVTFAFDALCTQLLAVHSIYAPNSAILSHSDVIVSRRSFPRQRRGYRTKDEQLIFGKLLTPLFAKTPHSSALATFPVLEKSSAEKQSHLGAKQKRFTVIYLSIV